MTNTLANLNFQHLRYFWVVAHAGSLRAGAERLHLTQSTLSAQIRQLESSLNTQLFLRDGRTLQVTPMGKTVLSYADEIFSLGNELVSMVEGPESGSFHRIRLQLGVANSVPKLVTRELLRPLLDQPNAMRVICREDDMQNLLSQLALNRLDLVLANEPTVSGLRERTDSHLLDQSNVVICAQPGMAESLRAGFPKSLSGAPAILPTEEMPLRASLERWFMEVGIRPAVVAEVADFALSSDLASCGFGFVPVLDSVREQSAALYGLHVIGPAAGVQVELYAITAHRQILHPGVELILRNRANSG